MKILFITIENHPGTLGGIQTFGRNLKNIYGEELIFLTNKINVEKKYKVEDVIEVFSSNKILRAINKLLSNIFRKVLIIQNIKRINPDVCILSSEKEIEFVKNIRTKVIFVQHSSPERYLKVNKNFLKKIIIRKPDCFVCSSIKDQEEFKINLKFDDVEFKVIRFPNYIPVLKEKKEKKKILIIIARLSNGSKRLDLAIKVMKKLPDFILNIYGNGEDEEFYKGIIKEEKITNVFLKGATNKVQERLDESGIFIMTSDFENYGIANIEAMRRGLPIIIRNTFNAAPDIVVDNTNGILLDKEWNEDKFVEAVRKVYDNYEYYSENSKKLGERYNPEIIKKEWDKVFLGGNNENSILL